MRLLILAAALFASLFAAGAQAQDAFEAQTERLVGASRAEISAIAADIAATGDPRAFDFLTALLDGRLYTRRSDDALVLAERIEGGFRIADPLTAAELGEVGRRDVRRIGINNRVRSELRGLLGELQLTAADPSQRLAAAEALLASPSPDAAGALDRAIAAETDDGVRAALALARAVIAVDFGSRDERLAAVATLDGSMEPAVWQVLGRLAQADGDADDAAVAAAAAAALEGIETQRAFYQGVETVFFGISLGAVLLLAAIGLAITFGVMGVINMAHGEMLMLGAYTTYVVQLLMPNNIEQSLFVAIPAAFLVTAIVGIGL
ncbi:MAG: urea ABC transporter permease subunit UrtB, partial [Pseudomonadota bacterium]